MRIQRMLGKLTAIAWLLTSSTMVATVSAQPPGACNTPVSERTSEVAQSEWRPSSGERIAVIGPLEIDAGRQYTARYMEAVFKPGMTSSIHRHSGPEAWYVLAGAQCLETPEGIIVARAGEGAVVRQGPLMRLSSVGTETRRSVLLVLHDASQPWIDHVSADWNPKGLCPK